MALVRQSAGALASGEVESIAERLLEQMLHRHARRPSPSEVRSWHRSLPILVHELMDAGLSGVEVMLERAHAIVEAGRAAPGHIFNLGHGVIPSTDPDQLKRLTDYVHEVSQR